MPFAKVKALLDSRSDRDILEGLRKVVSLMYQSKPGLPYFSSVVKNVANPNIEVKKLVYLYLLHYAESDPDLALLSVNAIQKSLTDQNPQVRAMALRTMSGMRVPVISQIVSLAIKRGCGDMSPHVRKAAALAIPKCYRLDPNTLPQLVDYLPALLGDRQYFVSGPAVSAFLEICPDRIDIVHKHYRSLVRQLVDMDEWSQLATMRLLLIYCRKSFPFKSQTTKTVKKKAFYDDESCQETESLESERLLDPDLERLLKSCKPLLESKSSAVIISVVGVYLYLGTPMHLNDTIGPLIALLRAPPAIQQVALSNIVSIALSHPGVFAPYTSHFLLHSTDPATISSLKLELLTLTFPYCNSHNISLILAELSHFASSPSSPPTLIRASLLALSRCASSSPNTSPRIFSILLKLITQNTNAQSPSASSPLVAESLTVLRTLIQQSPATHKQTIVRLARHLDSTTSPLARANIIWLVGEFSCFDSDLSTNIAPDVLRILVKNFAEEPEEAKGQIALLAAKVYLHYLSNKSPPPDLSYGQKTESNGVSSAAPENSHKIPRLWSYILSLLRYEPSYDLRDRARVYKALLSNPSSIELATLMLRTEKPIPVHKSPSEGRRGMVVGSAAVVTGVPIGGSGEELPDWVEEGHEPDLKLRDDGQGATTLVAVGAKTAAQRLDGMVREQGLSAKVENATQKAVEKGKSLDDWLDEEEVSEETEEEGSTEEESGTEEEDSESDSEDDEQEIEATRAPVT